MRRSRKPFGPQPGSRGFESPLLRQVISHRHGKPCLLCFMATTRGFEPMRSIRARKTARWAVFSESRGGFSRRGEARSAILNPPPPPGYKLQARETVPVLFFCKPVLTNGLFHLSRPDTACRAGGQADFQSSLVYRSTLRSSFKPPSLASVALAFLGANGPRKASATC